jgi:dTDP-4-dehydrorhamnose reductase
MTRVLVTGASGLLGIHLALQASRRHSVVGVVHTNDLMGVPFRVQQADLAQPGRPAALLEQVQPQVVVHCAALANLDACEQQPELAWRLNAEVPGELAQACAHAGIKLVHISTDAVFDGLRGDYREEDTPSPAGVYARSKLEGERRVALANPQAVIARVNFYGWSLSGQRSLAEFFYNNLSAGKQVNGFTDVLFCPLLTSDLADVLMAMVAKDLSGLYHVVSRESLSKYQFGCRIAEIFGLDAGLITPTTWRSAGLKAPRAPNLVLRSDKLASALGSALPEQQAGLLRLFAQQRDGLAQQVRLFRRLVA